MRTTGDIQARYQDGDQLRNTITDFSLDILIDVFYAIWALILVLQVSWEMFIIALVMQELVFIAQRVYQKRLEAACFQMKE